MRALLQYKSLDTVLYKWPTWEEGWLRSVCASSQSDKTPLFLISSEMDVHTTGLQKIPKKKKKNTH